MRKRIVFLLVVCMAFCLLYVNAEVVNAGTDASPWIIVEEYSIHSGKLVAGESGIIILKLRNTNTAKAAENALLTFSSTTGKVMPAEGNDNQVYINKINPGGTYEVEIPVSISTGAVGYDNISIHMQYFGPDGGYSMSNDSMVTLEIFKSNVTIGDVILNDDTNGLIVEYKNDGANDIYNLKIRIEGDIEFASTIDIGELVAGDKGECECAVDFKNIGKQRVQISVNYETEDGRVVQSEKESRLIDVQKIGTNSTDTSNKIMSDMDTIIQEDSSLTGILITCGIIIITVLLIHMTQKRRKA